MYASGKRDWGEEFKSQRKWKVLIALYFIASVTSWVGAAIFAISYPEVVDITFIWLFVGRNYNQWYFLPLILIHSLIMSLLFMGAACFASFVTIFAFTTHFIIDKLTTFSQNSNNPAHNFDNFKFLVYSYKELQVFFIVFNEVARPYFLLIVSNMLTGISVITLTLYIGYHRDLDSEILFATCLLLIMSTISVWLIYHECGGFNDKSIKIIKRLKRSIELAKLSQKNKALLQSYANTLPPLKIEYNSFGYYKLQNSPRIITRILHYSIKSVMILERVFRK